MSTEQANIKKIKRWICWKAEEKDNGKIDKIPKSPLDGVTNIAVNDMSNGVSFLQASRTARLQNLGVGILLGDGLSCIDLDHCVLEHGISDRAQRIINQMDSYTEFSPSGLGIHIFYYGEKPGTKCRMKMEDFEIEIYEKERFITFTGNQVYGNGLENRSDQIKELYFEIFGSDVDRVKRDYNKCSEPKKKLAYGLGKDRIFNDLWNGVRESDDESRNDLAIIGKLCYWLDRDPEASYKYLLKSPYFETKSDKHKDKLIKRYDNYFLPSFDKANDELDGAAWDWKKVKLVSKPKDVNVEEVVEATKVEDVLIEPEPEDDSEITYPWLGWDEKGTPYINEGDFSEWFMKKWDLMCINGVMYNEHGELADAYLLHKIQDLIKLYKPKGLARQSKALLDAIKNDSYTKLPRPSTNEVHINDKTLMVSANKLEVVEPKFTINRLNVNYDTDAKCPTWHKFLSELIPEAYIPILQEYMGYCLSPTNVSQVACFITGNGGEGKSIIIQVMQKILSRNQLTGQIHKLSSNNFMLSNLENKLAFLDDDINLAALDDTSVFKSIVTNNGEMMVERKGIQAYNAQIYAKILACGNGSLRSKYDKSDGFYRRLMIIKCLPKDKDRVDDKLLHVKILDESDGIFLWMLEGLQRLMGNGWYFTSCAELDENIEELKDEIENIRLFLRDRDYVVRSLVESTIDGSCLTSTTGEIVDCYNIWCEDNSYEPMSQRKISIFLSKHQDEYDIESSNKVLRDNVARRGYKYIQMKKATLRSSGNFNLIKNI